MNKAKQAEQERTEAAERAQAQWLLEHGAWNWMWPSSGDEDDLPRNCWFTNNPKPRHYPKAPGTSAVGGDQHIVGTQTYYGVPTERKDRRASRRASGRLAKTGLKFSRAHSYTRMGG